jgi:predicted ribonuclease YlaK
MAVKSKRNKTTPLYVIGGEKLLPINKFHLNAIVPKTDNQSLTFRAYSEGFNLVLAGAAGSGKSFLALHLALSDVLNNDTPYDKVVIVRSTVPTRNQGFLPGSLADKESVYQLPYKGLTRELISPQVIGDVYEKLKTQKSIEFMSTSFIRGITIHNAIFVVDEMQNLPMHELDSVFTRLGDNCKIIFCGDTPQSDLQKDKLEHIKFLNILSNMTAFKFVKFGVDDIVRNPLVKEYLTTKYRMGY